MRRDSYWLVAGALVLADQITKHLSTLLPHVVEWHGFVFGRVINTDGFYGLRLPNPVLIAFGLIICAGLVVLIGRGARRSSAQLGYWLILGGAASNLIDRIRVGGVVDIMGLRDVVQFNLADVMILLGALALLESLWKRDEQ